MTDENTWRIAPNEGLLPLRFGETVERVCALPILGAVVRRLPGAPGVVTEMRRLADPTLSYREDGLFYIAVGRQTLNVLFDTVDVFTTPPRTVLQALERANGAPGFL